MKQSLRLAIAVHPLLSGEWRRSVSTSIPKFTSLGTGICRSFDRFQCQGFKSLERAVHTALLEDDFSELGPPVKENGAKQLKLLTEKPLEDDFPELGPPAGVNGAKRLQLVTEELLSELGSPVRGNGAKQLKLATEKPEFLPKANPVPKVKPSRHSIKDVCHKISQTSKVKLQDQSDTSSSAVKQSHGPKVILLQDQSDTTDESSVVIKHVKDVCHKISQTSKVKLQDKSDTSSSAVKQSHGPKVDNALTTDESSVVIKHVPPAVGLSNLVRAMSVFGEVARACIRSVPDGRCCEVQFVNSESSRRALFARKVTLESINLPICSLRSSEIVSICIRGIGKGATGPRVHSKCKSIGDLKGLAMMGKDAVDVFYSVENKEELQRILERLNNTTVNGVSWSAYQRSSTLASEKESSLGLQLNNRLIELRRHMYEKKMWLEDLHLLHLGVMHLRGVSTNAEQFMLDSYSSYSSK